METKKIEYLTKALEAKRMLIDCFNQKRFNGKLTQKEMKTCLDLEAECSDLIKQISQ